MPIPPNFLVLKPYICANECRLVVGRLISGCRLCKKGAKTIDHLCKTHKKQYNAASEIDALSAEQRDKRHHAPLCPANHYHGRRAPMGRCNCGAEEVGHGG